MSVHGPLKWHGGKHYLAPKIVPLCPPHLRYCEPYAGGLSVMLAKDPEGVSEVANDLNGRLTRFWNVLAYEDYFPRFLRRVEATPFSEERWNWARLNEKLSPPETDDEWIAEAVDFFVLCRQSLAGRMKAFTPVTKTRTRRGMNNEVSAWLTAIEGLPAVHERLKRVLILNRPALEVIDYQDGPQTLFYLDPPYLHETRSTTAEYGAFEMTKKDHLSLLTLLSCIDGKFLLSGYPSCLYEDWARACGWHCRTFDLPNNAAGGKDKRRMTECLWSNFPLPAEGPP